MRQDLEFTNRAFEVLVTEHHHRVMAYVLSLTSNREAARDIVQEAFITAYRKLGSYDTSRNFGYWVRGIARLCYFEWLRKNPEFSMSPERLEQIDLQHALWDNREPDPGSTMEALHQCLQKLPEAMLQAVQQFYLEQQSGTDVANTLQISEATVRKRLQRARVWLGECIEQTLPTL